MNENSQGCGIDLLEVLKDLHIPICVIIGKETEFVRNVTKRAAGELDDALGNNVPSLENHGVKRQSSLEDKPGLSHVFSQNNCKGYEANPLNTENRSIEEVEALRAAQKPKQQQEKKYMTDEIS